MKEPSKGNAAAWFAWAKARNLARRKDRWARMSAEQRREGTAAARRVVQRNRRQAA